MSVKDYCVSHDNPIFELVPIQSSVKHLTGIQTNQAGFSDKIG